ncbi:MAG: PAS domain-containing protein [Erythrobacter sp.]
MRKTDDTTRDIRLFADSIPDIAWSANGFPTFEHFNARWEEVTGALAPQSVEDWRAFIHPEDYETSREKFEKSIKLAKDFEDEWRLKQADGTYRWVLSRAVPSTNDAKTARWFGTITDIDDAHRQSESRELLARELSHRIKNIFSVISGLISLRARQARIGSICAGTDRNHLGIGQSARFRPPAGGYYRRRIGRPAACFDGTV